jgi:acetoin utilization deacetylase AcuC-like enzyme
MRLYYSPDYVLAGYSFDTTRKAAWLADSLAADPIPGVDRIAPASLTDQEIATVHDPAYVAAVRTGLPPDLAESQGFVWDPGLWPMVCASNGGAVAAARAALQDGVAGSLSSGLHHARRAHGAGFCTFNGLVLAAHAACAAGVRRVLILDLDAHCGGGTYALIAADPRIWQLDVAVNPFDRYRPAARTTLDPIARAADYLPLIETRLEALAAARLGFDLCLYNAGMDPYEACPIGGCPGITRAILEARERLVFAWCRTQQIPVAFVLAGGYIGPQFPVPDLVALHRLTIAAATGQETMDDGR